MKKIAPYGTWPSSINAAMVAGKTPKISDLRVAGEAVFWCEAIAEEKGRVAIMRHHGGQLQCVLPRPLSAKSKVHEYGGAPYCVDGDQLFFVLADDQRIYRVDLSIPGFLPQALTPEAGGYRFADLEVDKTHQRIIAVCEEHTENAVVRNYLVSIAMTPSSDFPSSDFIVLAQGDDFYSNPRLSPDGNTLCWISWNHPAMPWDNSALWLAELHSDGLGNARKLVGNGGESLFQPQWSPDQSLYFVSDRTNWWNIYRIDASSLNSPTTQVQCVLEMEAEFATPQWAFGMSTYGFIDESTIVASYFAQGIWHLAEINLADASATSTWRNIATDVTVIDSVQCADGKAVFIAAAADKFAQVYVYQSGGGQSGVGQSGVGQFDAVSALTTHPELLDADEYSRPQSISFPTSDSYVAQALFYPPNNMGYASEQEKPPLIVICHGGPTGATSSGLNLKVQYWTNRGFAVADVNYRGSSGYGRKYRQLLNGKWGIYDVDDVCAVVDFLAAQQSIDPMRTIIKGSSAGGYSVLAALAFRDTFCAGVSLYGIGDLELLVADTHKFEARYLDQLIGPYPEQQALYRARSPLYSAAKIACPLLLMQGMQDKVVPPNQAETLFTTLKEQGQKVALVCYADEGHGFRAAATIEHSLLAEMQFYSKIFQIPMGSEVPGLFIENMEG